MKISLLKRYFLTGVLVLVPLLTTAYIVVAAFNILHSAVGRHIDALLAQIVTVNGRPYPLPGIGVLVSLLVVIAVGVLTSTVIGNRLFRYGERLLTRVPVAKKIYPAAKQIIEFVVSPKDPSFRKVVAVPFPMRDHLAIGFQTGEAPEIPGRSADEKLVSVFIPHSPSPITGFTIIMPISDVIPLDMTPEEAVKFIVSAGVLVSENGTVVASHPPKQ